jgi:hypothetical protein
MLHSFCVMRPSRKVAFFISAGMININQTTGKPRAEQF